MSLEIRRGTEGDCVCPHSHPDGSWRCRHWWECDFGILEHTDPRPDRGEIGYLMVSTQDYFENLLQSSTVWPRKGWRRDSASVRGGRRFQHSEWNGQRWTWELFDAHFHDRGPTDKQQLLIGRWPD